MPTEGLLSPRVCIKGTGKQTRHHSTDRGHREWGRSDRKALRRTRKRGAQRKVSGNTAKHKALAVSGRGGGEKEGAETSGKR